MLGRISAASRVGFTYIGTVVGAGFASGQEVLSFFSIFGPYSFWGILISTLLFSWLGMRMMLIGHRLRADSFEDFNLYLFGAGMGKWMNYVVGLALFGVTTAMLAGTGALFEEQFGFPFHFGVLFTATLSFFVIQKGMDGILSLNTVIVPMMFLFTFMIGLKYMWNMDLWTWGISSPSMHKTWILSALTYVAFNLSMSQAVLVPLGGKIADESTIRIGAWIGGLGLGFMLVGSNAALQSHFLEIHGLEIPMAYIVQHFWVGLKVLFGVVLWAEIFTTLIGNVYGLAIDLHRASSLRLSTITVILFLLAYGCSLIGFSSFVKHVYPVMGYGGLVVVLLLIVRPLPRV